MCPYAALRDADACAWDLQMDSVLTLANNPNQYEKVTLQKLLTEHPHVYDEFRWRSSISSSQICISHLKTLNFSVESALSSLIDCDEIENCLKSLLSLLETEFKPSPYVFFTYAVETF